MVRARAAKRAKRMGSNGNGAVAADALLKESEAIHDSRRALAEKLLEEGRALAGPLIEQVKDPEKEDPDKNLFQKPVDLLEACLGLDHMTDGATEELNKIMEVFGGKIMWVTEEPEEVPRPEPNHNHALDVVVVGAGASGVGVGLMLTRVFNLDPERVLLVERGERVGESFHRWPKEMRFISPSFNNQGWTNSFDLNSIAYGTSPAFTLQTEHPNGQEYAHYLNELATQGELNIRFQTQVNAIEPLRKLGLGKISGFKVKTSAAKVGEDGEWMGEEAEGEVLSARYVVWAAGEFQYPRAKEQDPFFPGAELCRHNSSVRSWKELPGDDFVVIGGYESGMDALYNLTTCGKRTTVVSSTAFWKVATDDPSTELAPYTMERVRDGFRRAPTPPRLLAPLRVTSVERQGKGYAVKAKWGAPVEHEGGEHRTAYHGGDAEIEEVGEEGTEVELVTPQAPLLCTGFEGSAALGVVKDLFEWGDEDAGGCLAGAPLLNDFDESTKTQGLFLVGPAVRHDEHIFCFVYKFRQRFAVVADEIARGLGFDTEETVEECREHNMYLDDFTCCKGACGETC